MDQLQYLSGFGNFHSSEALPNALPLGQNSPQKVPYGLYAEQLSNSPFTAPRNHNYRNWFYRIQPSVVQGQFEPYHHDLIKAPPFNVTTPPTQMRWQPLPYPDKAIDFIDSWITFAGHGNVKLHQGCAIHLYTATADMKDRYFYNTDGELLVVPQEGNLLIKTEYGMIDLTPGEIAVIPQGVKFQVELPQQKARGYICENFGLPFVLPELGPIGANGLANPRDFLVPIACFEEKRGNFTLLNKYQGNLWQAKIDHSPLDVVAWHGNHAPYKYDLKNFNTIFSVSFDHTDPSIFTVLTSQSSIPGTANIDFVIFPSRWVVMEHSIRIPYYHRNIMSEFMGLIYGNYDAKKGGFVPGGASLHNSMAPHGPDADAYQQDLNADLKPTYYENTLAFMFESYFAWEVSEFALTSPCFDKNYIQCWQGLAPTFTK